MFPRHVLEHVVRGARSGAENVANLATSHDNVTVMFMDIVGRSTVHVSCIFMAEVALSRYPC